MEILTSVRGKPQLGFEGYTYRLDKRTVNSINWRCTSDKKFQCKARSITSINYEASGELPVIHGEHSHPPDVANIELKVLQHRNLQRSAATRESPCIVVEKKEQNVLEGDPVRIRSNAKLSEMRISLKKPENPQRLSTTSISTTHGDTKEVKPRPVDVTLTNQMEEDFWFLVFQIEKEIDEVESYITPWVGAQIAETPASVGPIRVPPTFEIAVIDTAPGGFGLQRTTGPFYVEPGDVWEVETPSDGAASPEMFYCDGLNTDDGSILVYAPPDNAKKFEIAIFKSGRKLFSRKNVKPGESVSLNVKEALYFMAVDQDTYYDMEGQDIRASECIGKATCIDINYRHSKMRIASKKRGENIFFTKL